ncbi:MAG: hypothetical protein V7L23_15260 [Nostoc sp.]|uniref:hypothetical protein n=1 Tax=Nostoc sp. TaxID=1180 RepID=UPI002FF0F53F
MSITIPTVRNKSVTVNASPTIIEPLSPVEVDQTDSIFFPVASAAPIDPPAFTIAATTATGNVSVSTSASFAGVRVGDVVTGTGIATDQPVTVVAVVSNTVIHLSEAATASGTVTLTFNPPAVTATYYGIELQHTYSGSIVTLSAIVLHKFDGTLGGTAGLPSNSTAKINLVPVSGSPGGALGFDTEAFLTNLRVPKLP